jgi:NADH:ubiquinone oxidoreductase subunit 5 (subunit L)/multisubunit Na+/H+ antiporter MnhA subunit
MVTAGVYLLVRSSPILEYGSTALILITWVGALTAFFAATTGLLQNDLKRVIAYSTCSQLGLLFLVCGQRLQIKTSLNAKKSQGIEYFNSNNFYYWTDN